MERVNISQMDFKYCGVNYDYDTQTSCEESGCDSICRCGVIVNKEVTSVDVPQMAYEIYVMYFPDSKQQLRDDKINSVLYGSSKELNIYCIDRILRHYKVWENGLWDIESTGGYYGEEIGRVTFGDQLVANKIDIDIRTVLSLNTIRDKVNFILKLEYGYILPELYGVDYELVDVPLVDVIFGSDGHYEKIQTKNLEHYIDISYSGIRGLVKNDGDKYKIIDGYHRMYAAGIGKIKKDIVRVILVKNV